MKNNNQKSTNDVENILMDVAFGLVAGAVGTFVMGKVTNYMYKHEDPEAQQEYQEVTGGKYVPERTAETIERTLGLEVTKKTTSTACKRQPLGRRTRRGCCLRIAEAAARLR